MPTCSTCVCPSLAGQGGGKMKPCRSGPPPSPSLPAVRRAIIGRVFEWLIPPVRCPHCQQRFRLLPDLKVGNDDPHHQPFDQLALLLPGGLVEPLPHTAAELLHAQANARNLALAVDLTLQLLHLGG